MTALASRFAARSLPRGVGIVPKAADLPWIIGYAIAFWVAHQVAAEWGGRGYYSLLYPAAGFRMALLWRRGTRLLPGIVIAEVVVQLLTGVIDVASPGWVTAVCGVVRPALAYGVVVMLVRRLADRAQTSLSAAPMPLGLASVGAPVAAALAALPWSLLRPDLTGVSGLRDVVASLTGFVVGDLLGVLLLTPPLLWLAELATDTGAGLGARSGSGSGSGPRSGLGSGRLRVPAMIEAMLVLCASFVAEMLLARIGLGTPHTPVLLAVAWIGLRFGRAASWLAIVVVAAIVLPQTAMPMPTDVRLALHMSLASILVVGYLAGSFADAQARVRVDLMRRDRLLFQAERLKTLRAMSVAVIHEISQPLSTLAIEAKHLHEITVSADPEVAATAALIDRKAAALSTLVRRLRRFGGRSVDQPSPVPLTILIDTVAALARPEAQARNVTLSIDVVAPDLLVLAQEVELAQAIVNLVRNAVQACGDGRVALAVARLGDGAGDEVEITVLNRCRSDRLPQSGMGVGVLVARAIVEAHGGRLTRSVDPSGQARATIVLPLLGEAA